MVRSEQNISIKLFSFHQTVLISLKTVQHLYYIILLFFSHSVVRIKLIFVFDHLPYSLHDFSGTSAAYRRELK